MSTPPEDTRHHSSTQSLVLLHLRAIYFSTFQYETPCIPKLSTTSSKSIFQHFNDQWNIFICLEQLELRLDKKYWDCRISQKISFNTKNIEPTLISYSFFVGKEGNKSPEILPRKLSPPTLFLRHKLLVLLPTISLEVIRGCMVDYYGYFQTEE